MKHTCNSKSLNKKCTRNKKNIKVYLSFKIYMKIHRNLSTEQIDC